MSMNAIETPARRVAVVGAGLSGLACAEAVQARGAAVTVFDKSRGPSGRMSTRRGDTWQCDHGAQYFTARDATFRAEVDRWVSAGVAAPWQPRLAVFGARPAAEASEPTARFVGTPRMTSPAGFLAQGLNVQLQTTVTALVRQPTGWQLQTAEHGLLDTQFDAVLLAVPSPQAVPLLQGPAPDLATLAAGARMRGSWALMLRYDAPVALPFDAAFVNQGPLRWVARDSSKPGRPAGPGETWLLHAEAEWSEAHIEDTPEQAAEAMLTAFEALGAPRPATWTAHRWRYADTAPPLEKEALWLPALGLGVCGDWLGSGKVEGAWRSGRALAALFSGAVRPA